MLTNTNAHQAVGATRVSWNTGYVETWLITLCQQYFCIVGCHLVNGFAPSFPAILSENFDLQNLAVLSMHIDLLFSHTLIINQF